MTTKEKQISDLQKMFVDKTTEYQDFFNQSLKVNQKLLQKKNRERHKSPSKNMDIVKQSASVGVFDIFRRSFTASKKSKQNLDNDKSTNIKSDIIKKRGKIGEFFISEKFADSHRPFEGSNNQIPKFSHFHKSAIYRSLKSNPKFSNKMKNIEIDLGPNPLFQFDKNNSEKSKDLKIREMPVDFHKTFSSESSDEGQMYVNHFS